MKSFLLLLVAVTTLTVSSNAQGGARERKSPHDTISNDNISITYGRPYKKDREIFGKLEGYGKVWRVGADEATTITFKKAAKVGDVTLQPGTYTMFALVNEKEWTIIFNSELGQWGAYSYDKNKAKDVAKITVPTSKTSAMVEQLTITINADNSLTIAWDNTQVSVPIKI